jgi:hypothetical protein
MDRDGDWVTCTNWRFNRLAHQHKVAIHLEVLLSAPKAFLQE